MPRKRKTTKNKSNQQGADQGYQHGHHYGNDTSPYDFPSHGRGRTLQGSASQEVPTTTGRPCILGGQNRASPLGPCASPTHHNDVLRPLGRASLVHQSDLLPSIGRGSLFSRPIRPVPGQCAVQPEWRDLSRAPPAYQMQYFNSVYGDDNFPGSREDTQKYACNKKIASKNIAIVNNVPNLESTQPSLESNVEIFEASRGQQQKSTTAADPNSSTVGSKKSKKKFKLKKLDKDDAQKNTSDKEITSPEIDLVTNVPNLESVEILESCRGQQQHVTAAAAESNWSTVGCKRSKKNSKWKKFDKEDAQIKTCDKKITHPEIDHVANVPNIESTQLSLESNVEIFEACHGQQHDAAAAVEPNSSTFGSKKSKKKSKWKTLDIATPAPKVSDTTWQAMEPNKKGYSNRSSQQFPTLK